jgi:hypothetical protein
LIPNFTGMTSNYGRNSFDTDSATMVRRVLWISGKVSHKELLGWIFLWLEHGPIYSGEALLKLG